MIAISAVRAIWSPNVGPIELAEKSRPPHAEVLVERRSTWLTCAGSAGPGLDLEDVLAEPRVVDLLDLGVAEADRVERVRTSSTLAGCSSGVLIRVPDSKSMPKLMPERRRSRSRRSARITPDIEKNHVRLADEVEAPGFPSSPAPEGEARAGLVRLIEPRIADVASTAVNSETSVPMPSVNAKP